MSKINLYATIMPFDFNIALSFHESDTIGDIHFFLEETFKKLRIKYKVGRIEIKNKKAWLLPQYVIGQFLSQKEEIVVYSIEYGIRQREISDGNGEQEDIDELFIGKKLKRKREDEDEDGKKSFIKSKIASINAKRIKNNLQMKLDRSNRKETIHSEDNDKKDREAEQSEDNEEEEEEEEKKKSSEEDEEDNQSNEDDDHSGSDKDEDIQIVTNKQK